MIRFLRIGIPSLLGIPQDLVRIDPDRAADRDELANVKQPSAGFVGDYKLLWQSEACGEFRLREASLLASIDQKGERGPVEVGIERRPDRHAFSHHSRSDATWAQKTKRFFDLACFALRCFPEGDLARAQFAVSRAQPRDSRGRLQEMRDVALLRLPRAVSPGYPHGAVLA